MTESEVPEDIQQAGPDMLGITWKDGHKSLYNVRELRLACPCATCVDEITGEKLLDHKRVPEAVKPERIVGVGHYAIKIDWSDGHDTGIYTFTRLRKMGS
jgi:ATP-binding protein involved in chromosome partitioning